jgi:ankyrin repeat protein
MVAKMMKICPDLPAAKDCLGRTPLHVAAGSAATPSLIKLIAHAHPASCDAIDEDGKTPLHFACDSSCELFEDDATTATNNNGSRAREVCHDTVRALLSESLHAVTIEDVDEMNALEYAIMSDAQLKTIHLLQLASRKSFESSLQQPLSLPPAILDNHAKVDDLGTIRRCSDNNDSDTDDVIMEEVSKEEKYEEDEDEASTSRDNEMEEEEKSEGGDLDVIAPVRVSCREDEIR